MRRNRTRTALLAAAAAAFVAAQAAAQTGGQTMIDVDLNGTWQVRQEPLTLIGPSGLQQISSATDGWLKAQVPGEIHLDLVRAGLMKEPSVGNNALADREPELKSWWYKTSFEVGEDFAKQERQELVFDGLDLYAQVFVNGRLAGEATDAFIPHRFDVKWLVHPGRNELVVRMTVGTELSPDDAPPGQGNQPHKPTFGEIPNPAKPGDPYSHRNWYGRKWLRKPQASYGWDWQEALPNIGIIRGVRLEGRSYAVLPDVRLDTVRTGNKTSLELEAIVENIHPWTERACTFELKITPPDGGKPIVKRYELSVVPGRTAVRDLIPVPDPKLWWPNGMGEQPLYQVDARVLDPKGIATDEKKLHIGLRTIEIDRTKLAEGSRFSVRVNGQPVFCRGGNLGPHDIIPARITDAKYRALADEARNAGMTMFRINGVSDFEPAAFYDACDRDGILIFHDFPFSCATYPDHDENFRRVVRDETETALKLLRHHPSIAIWSGGNECIWGLCDWYNGDKSKQMDIGGTILYNQVLPDACRNVDPRRPYWPSSPCGGDDPGSDLQGDCHWWGAYLSRDLYRRIRHEVFDECRGRFVSEWGFPGPCDIDSIAEYLEPADRTPGTAAWNTHTNQLVNDTLDGAIRYQYVDPQNLSLEAWSKYGQMAQATFYGHTMEALRFRKNDPAYECQGALIWSYSDCWGETGWSLLDYYLRRKASYYWVRRACRPVKVIVRKRGDKLVTRLINDTLKPVAVTVEYGWWRLDGKDRKLRSHKVTVPANGMKEIGSDAIAPNRAPADWLYAAVMRDADGKPLDQNIWTLAPFRELHMAKPALQIVPQKDGSLEITSPVFAHAVHVTDHGKEIVDDNWFDILPGIPVHIKPAKGVKTGSLIFEPL